MLKCKKCQELFPVSIFFDGKKRNLSNRKYCLICSPFGNGNNKKLSSYNNNENNNDTRKCSKCNQIKSVNSFSIKKTEKRFSSQCKDCLYKFQKERWKKRKIEAINLLGGKCNVCGYCKNYAAMEFHHLNPNEKDSDWAKTKEKSWVKIVEELKKCVLLCSNCHRETHNPNASICENVYVNISLQEYKTLEPTGMCKICGNNVYGTKYCSKSCSKYKKHNSQEDSVGKNFCLNCQKATFNKYCSQECYHVSNRKTKRPDKETLEILIKEMKFTKIGKKYGVSDNAVRKWARSYGLIN